MFLLLVICEWRENWNHQSFELKFHHFSGNSFVFSFEMLTKADCSLQAVTVTFLLQRPQYLYQILIAFLQLI